MSNTEQKLSERADQIVSGLDQAIVAGLDPYFISYIRRANQYSEKDLTQDAWMVLLGIKPVASYALQSLGYLRMDERGHAFDFIPPPETGPIIINDDLFAIWNPHLVLETLRNYPDANAYNHNIDPYNKEDFPDLINRICHQRLGPWDTYLAGLLHGIPEPDVRNFVEHRPKIEPAVNVVWETAREKGIPTTFNQPTLGDFFGGPIELRDEFARLAPMVGLVDQSLVEYIRYVRPSKTPGSPYMTSGRTIQPTELQLIQTYDASGIERKLDLLLAKHLNEG